jgi:hypothetical protein
VDSTLQYNARKRKKREMLRLFLEREPDRVGFEDEATTKLRMRKNG